MGACMGAKFVWELVWELGWELNSEGCHESSREAPTNLAVLWFEAQELLYSLCLATLVWIFNDNFESFSLL